MQPTLEFLRLVTPGQGVKAVVVLRGVSPKTGKPLWLHLARDSHAQLAATTVDADTTSKHVYFALGGYRPNTLEEGKGRLQSNVDYLRTLWLDIDVDPTNPKKYLSQREAAAALLLFVESLSLPDPLIVGSGRGLHVYWPLDRDVTREEWKPVANALKAAAIAAGIKADHGITANEAAVLRPVGTHNRKRDEVKPVRVILPGAAPSSLETLAQALGAAESQQLPSTPPHIALPDANPLAASLAAADVTPKSFSKVLTKCPQMRWALEHMRFGQDGKDPLTDESGEPVSEPLWRAGLSIAVSCKNGPKHAHTLSSLYPGYSPEETQAKLARVNGTPYTCTKFRELNSKGCAGCAYIGKVKSPIVLGTDYLELAPPEIVITADVVEQSKATVHGFVVATNELRIAGVNPPFPYKRTDSGLVRLRQVPALDEAGVVIKGKFVEEEQKFADYDIYPLFRTREKVDGIEAPNYASYWRVIPTHHRGMVEDIFVPHGDLHSDDRLKALLYSKAVYTANLKEHQEIGEYMRSYMKRLSAEHTHPQPTHFGWQQPVDAAAKLNDQPMEFVSARSRIRRYKANGKWYISTEAIYPSPAMSRLSAVMSPKGTIEGWATAAGYYKDSYASHHIACVLLGLGGPFMRYTKDSGVVILARGEKGVGKSHLLSLVASAWGDPLGYIGGGTNTINSAEAVAGLLKHLPVVMDDKLERSREEISQEIMVLANGKGKGRATMAQGTQNALTVAGTTTWLTNTLMSSNHSWSDILNANKIGNEGETARLIEIELQKIPREAWPVTGLEGENQFRSAVRANIGVVGPLLMQQFMEDPEGAVARLSGYESAIIEAALQMKESDPRLSAIEPSDFRLQSAAGACGLLVLHFLRKANVVLWIPKVFVKVILEVIAETCRRTTDNRPEKADILAQYINEQHGNFVVVSSEGMRIGGLDSGDAQAVGKVPHMRIVGRMDHVEKTIHLDRAAFKTWLAERSVSETNVLVGLKDEGWEVEYGQNTKSTLGKGFPNTSKVQTRSIKLTNAMLFGRLVAIQGEG